ncbi:MAG: alpha/beta hydrolase [Promethearchaeota archaeon]
MNKKQYFSVKDSNYLSLILNLTSILLGIIYLIFPVYNVSWDLLGIIYLITLFINFCNIYYTGNSINKSIKLGNRLNILCYCYSLILGISMLLMMFGNFFNSVTYSPTLSDNIGSYVMIYGAYFGSLFFQCTISILIIKNLREDNLWNLNTSSTTSKLPKKIGKIIIQLVTPILFVLGFYMVFVILGGISPMLMTQMFEMFVPELSLFFAFIFFSATVIFLKTITRKEHKAIFYGFGFIGLFISVICMFPFISTPFAVGSAEKSFSSAFNPTFGGDWRNEIDTEAKQYFLRTPFSIPQYFLGISSQNYNYKVISDVTYFNGSESSYLVDKHITLCFDVFMPINNGIGLPGQNSTLIRIHGGSWRSYDKGLTNGMETNKYFASQGYVVFDIQYGLYSEDPQEKFMTPKHVQGNFTVEDMVRHIGNFTYYLSENANKYGANLNSVFISGGSAGGQLACASALTMASGNFSDLFSRDLNVKGYIPFYPAFRSSDLTENFDFWRPQLLVNESSPPCLIFQGLQDGLVNPERPQNLSDTYALKGNTECAIIYFPFARHANDLFNFESHFNLVFTYYMERFMYLYH